MQAGDLEQIVDPFVQTDEFQLAAALSRRRPDADEGADAHAVHWLTLARSTRIGLPSGMSARRVRLPSFRGMRFLLGPTHTRKIE